MTAWLNLPGIASMRTHLSKLFALLCLLLGCGAAHAQSSQAPSPQPSAKITEDWSDISLASSHLRAAPPALGQRDELPTYTREWLQLQWRDEDPIYVIVMLPKGVVRPPAVLYLYSFPSELERFEQDEFGRLATSHGVAAVGFVSALTGHRFHPPRSLDEWFVSELQESLATSTHDVQMILNYLASRGDVDMNSIGMFGEGSGASIAILAAAADPRIKALDLLAPWGDWPRWLAQSSTVPDDERAAYLKPEFLKKVENLDPVKYLPGLRDRNLWLQFSQTSPIVPPQAREAMLSAAPAEAKTTIYRPGAPLSATRPDDKFFDWIQQKVSTASLLAPVSTGQQK